MRESGEIPDHAPEQAAVILVFHQPAAHQVRSDFLRRAAEEGVREGLEVREGLGGYGGGLARLCGQNKNAPTPKSE